ncbi:hypothetical protein SAMN06264346_11344 [Chryseobacterium profundimaris]|uniref:Uncharacterized protein n=1 Tax=Chryseobacterium profundimaris TaxID=1387275 RepID=A0ABY1PFL2_9FLAO|nr:hypothetical protein SAMN06264346_11344 [Chryseobacterium profundimaris]
MKVAITAFLLAKGNVNVDHKKSPEKIQSSNVFNLNQLISITSVVNEVIKVVSYPDHEAVSSIFLNIR